MSTELEQILVAVDFGPGSRHAVRVAAELAKRVGSRLVLVHVVPLTSFREYLDALISNTLWSVESRLSVVNAAEDELQAHVERLAATGIEADATVLEGEPSQELLHFARDQRCNLILLGRSRAAPGRRPWRDGVAAHVARGADVPVMLVSPPEPQASVAEGAGPAPA